MIVRRTAGGPRVKRIGYLVTLVLTLVSVACYEAIAPVEPPPVGIRSPELQLPDTGTADGASLLPLTVVIDTATPIDKRSIVLGTTGGLFAGTGTITTSVSPDALGVAHSLLRAPTDSTTVIVSATVNGVTVSKSATYRRAMPDLVDVVPGQLVLDVASTNELALTATLRRTVGKPSPNLRVTFTAFEGSLAGKPIGAFLPATAVSDANGVTTSKFFLADTAKRGPIVIRASVDPAKVSGDATIAVTGPPPRDTTKKSAP